MEPIRVYDNPPRDAWPALTARVTHDDAEIDRRVHEAADFVGLDPALLERSPFELSGGQKRRVAVAGVMAMKPRILVLDDGHINGFDTHENLLKSNAIYREIYESQMQGGGDFDQPA